MIERHFGDIKDVIAVHSNLIISTVSLHEHDKTFRNVLERAKDHNIKFNFTRKYSYIKYLENIVSKEELKPDPEKVKAIFEISQPKNKQDTQRILGMVHHLWQYIPNLSQISYPLCNFLKKGISWHWSHEHSKALKEIQIILTAKLILSFFDTKWPIEIQVDASSHGLGVFLM